MSNNIIKPNQWKLRYVASGQGSYAVLVRLRDLIWKDPDTRTTWDVGEGLNLGHDIICFNPDIYNSSAILDVSTDITDRQKYGVFGIKPTVDKRILNANESLIRYGDTGITSGDAIYSDIYGVWPSGVDNGYRYPIMDPRVFLYPQDEDFSFAGKVFNRVASGSDYWRGSFSVAIDESTAATGATLIVADPDQTLEASLVGSNLLTFRKVRLNLSIDAGDTPEFVKFFTGYEGTAEDSVNPALNPFIDEAYIYLSMAFFADYVSPESFEQDLNASAQAVHRDLILGGGDFKNFGTEAEDGLGGDPDVPYLSITPPTENLITDIGRPPIPTQSGDTTAGTGTSLLPIGWIDSATDSDDDAGTDFTTALSARKTPYASKGNVYEKGRIHSPSIDEIWIALKKLISGRAPDNAAGAAYLIGPKSLVGNPTYSEESTLPLAEKALDLPNSKQGDPLSYDGSSFISKPQGFQLILMPELEAAADRILGPSSGANISQGTLYQPVDPADLQEASEYSPRPEPYSLRELEGLVANTRFNFMAGFNFILSNKVSTGNTSSDDTSLDVGTLYQLHKNFVPNTQSDDNEDIPTQSKWKTYADTADSLDTSEYGDSLPEATPGSYDAAVDQSRQDIVLTAEGEWRYIWDHVRVPILGISEEAY